MNKDVDIDFVLTWVDCNDLKWKKIYSDFTGKDIVSEVNRYRDWGFLKYWFRAVEKYAPWVHKIYFVTCGQSPDFLNVNHPKIVMINHEDYIDKKYLPTFNSNVIEMNLFRIKSLSEQFVLFNDDMFLNAPVTKETFFNGGLPCDSAVLDMVIPPGEKDVFYHAILNNVDIINKYFDKREVMKANWSKWYQIKYREGFIRNMCLSPWKMFAGFKNYHLPNNFLKSTFEEIYEKESGAFEKCYSNNFRGFEDITQYLAQYWQLASGRFYPSVKRGHFYEIGPQTSEILKVIEQGKDTFICLNDDSDKIDYDAEKKRIIDVFERVYPSKSSFEL